MARGVHACYGYGFVEAAAKACGSFFSGLGVAETEYVLEVDRCCILLARTLQESADPNAQLVYEI